MHIREGAAREMSDQPRDAGMFMELREGTGGIVTMCSVDDVLEIYKVDRCFELRSPDAVDPERTDPNAPWTVRQVSSFGSANDIVARTFLQTVEFVGQGIFDRRTNKDAVRSAARKLRDSLLACHKLSAEINKKVAEVVAEYEHLEVRGNIIPSFPTYPNLVEAAGSFLLHAKQSLQHLSAMFNALFATDFKGPRYDKILKWTLAELSDSEVPKLLNAEHERLRHIVDLRNFYEHPGKKKTTIKDFYWDVARRTVHLPTWNITDEPESSIAKDTAAIADFLVDFAEAFIALSALEATSDSFPFMLVRDSPPRVEMPTRFSLTVDMTLLKGTT